MRLCTKYERTKDRTRRTHRSWLPGGPAIRITVCMRPHSFASLARAARNENEDDTKSISRLRGIRKAGLTPLNLRYIRIYIHVHVHIYIRTYVRTYVLMYVRIRLCNTSMIFIDCERCTYVHGCPAIAIDVDVI
jgi:hypothetical protein